MRSVDNDIGKLLSIRKNPDQEELEFIPDGELETKAYLFAKRMHKGQTRSTGGAYINHPIRVAEYVRKYKTPTHIHILVAAALLHDTLENTVLNYYDLVTFFGAEVASIVLELTIDEDMKAALGKTKYLKIRMKNMSSWALTIKLCDRLDNCSDLLSCNGEFQERYLFETLDILEYICELRNLTKTQIRLVGDILDELMPLKDMYDINERVAKLRSFICKEEEKQIVLNPISNKLLPGLCKNL